MRQSGREAISYFARYSALVRGHGRAVAVVALLFCATSSFESALLPLAFRTLIDDVLTPRNEVLLVPLLTGLIVAGVAYAAIAVLRDVLHVRVSHAILVSVRDRLYVHLQRQSVGFHARAQTPTLVAHFTTDLAAVENGIVLGVTWGLIAVFGLLLSAGLLFALEWQLALLALAGLALSTVGPWLLGGRASRASSVLREEQALLAARIQEDLAAHPTVLAFGMQESLRARFQAELARFYRVSTRAQVLGAMVERTPNIAMLAFNLAVLTVGAVVVFRGSMTVGSLVAFYTVSNGLSFSVANMTWSLPYLIAADSGLRRIEGALAEKPEVTDGPGAKEAGPLREAIELDQVDFGYTADRPILRKLCVRLPRGAFCVFVGSSGAGKSSVLNLMLRFFDVRGGAVRWDGTDLRELSQASLRAQMAVVFQDNVIFQASVRDNLTMAFPAATDEQVRAALRDAELLDHIDGLPDGLATILGDGGVGLSGGQRQRLAIARALLRNPSVLVLDESTSALDSGTETLINETLRRIGRTRTVISMTHRLACAVDADIIFVMENGSLAESGSHDALLRSGRVYPGLWTKQSGFTVSTEGDWATVDAARLRALPLLNKLSAEQLEILAQQFHAESFQADREVVREGDPGDRFYLIARGEVAVSRLQADGAQRRIALLRDGDHFGEVALLHDRPRTATVRTTCPSIVLSVQRRHFLSLIEGMPALRDTLSREAGRRLSELH
jgi:ATP-binding cassette, subfamily B, bacterial